MIITHGHSDHFGSSHVLREATGAKIAIHKNDSYSIITGKNPVLYPTNQLGRLLKLFLPESVKKFLPFEPDIIIENEMSLSEYGIAGRIIMTPGHTAGSVSILLDDGNVFVGDAIMGGMIGKGRARFPIYAEDVEKAKESIKYIISLSPKMIYTGHGGPFSQADIKINL